MLVPLQRVPPMVPVVDMPMDFEPQAFALVLAPKPPPLSLFVLYIPKPGLWLLLLELKLSEPVLWVSLLLRSRRAEPVLYALSL